MWALYVPLGLMVGLFAWEIGLRILPRKVVRLMGCKKGKKGKGGKGR
jgi:hypothetical protein